MKFLQNFPGGVFQIFKDNPKSKGYPEVMTEYNEEYLRKVNKKGCGVYFTVNAFSATEEERDKLWEEKKKQSPNCSRPTARNKPFLRKINAMIADLDLAKENVSETTMEDKKKLAEAIKEKLNPNFIIDTKNGIQPIWLLEEDSISEETQNLYRQVANGIIKWSKTVGAAGDDVKDTTRVLRLPNYYHMKGEPYLCRAASFHSNKTTLEEMLKVFPFKEKKEYKHTSPTTNDFSNNPVSMAIERLDFQEVIIRAFNSVGRSASFDEQKRLILDGRLTGTHQGKTGDCRFLASNSHEKFSGPLIKVVGDILNTTPTEGRQWIVDTYNLDFKKVKAQQAAKKILETKIEDKDISINEGFRATWGTRKLNTTFALVKPGNLVIIGGYQDSGKTTFSMYMATQQAAQGHKVLYLTLEMAEEDLYENLARSYAGITVEEEYDKKIPVHKMDVFEKRKKELKSIKGLEVISVRRGDEISWDTIHNLLMEKEGQIIYIDNLDLISNEKGEESTQKQERVTKAMMGFTSEYGRVIYLIHHMRKPAGSKANRASINDLRGSGKISDNADRVLIINRRCDEEGQPVGCESEVILDKGRIYPRAKSIVYFNKGAFQDEDPKFENIIDIKW